MAIEGGCRCGEVRFRLGAPAVLTMACHCKGCQRMTGGAFSLSALIPDDGFEIVAGLTVLGGLLGVTEHHHCPRCLSWLFTYPEGVDGFVNIRSTMLDKPGDLASPFVEVWTEERLPDVSTGARHSFGRLPDEQSFRRLAGAYATRAS